MYYDKNQNNPNVWVFEPDLARPAANPSVWKGGQLRLTWQAAAKHKIGVNWNEDSVRYAPTSVSLTPCCSKPCCRGHPVTPSPPR